MSIPGWSGVLQAEDAAGGPVRLTPEAAYARVSSCGYSLTRLVRCEAAVWGIWGRAASCAAAGRAADGVGQRAVVLTFEAAELRLDESTCTGMRAGSQGWMDPGRAGCGLRGVDE